MIIYQFWPRYTSSWITSLEDGIVPRIENPMPKSAIETLEHCDVFYPNIKMLPHILQQLPW